MGIAGWLAVQLAKLVGRLVGRLVGHVSWPVGQFVGRLVGCLVGRLVDRQNSFCDIFDQHCGFGDADKNEINGNYRDALNNLASSLASSSEFAKRVNRRQTYP